VIEAAQPIMLRLPLQLRHPTIKTATINTG